MQQYVVVMDGASPAGLVHLGNCTFHWKTPNPNFVHAAWRCTKLDWGHPLLLKLEEIDFPPQTDQNTLPQAVWIPYANVLAIFQVGAGEKAPLGFSAPPPLHQL
jgi:hypothetical protein